MVEWVCVVAATFPSKVNIDKETKDWEIVTVTLIFSANLVEDKPVVTSTSPLSMA